MRAHEIEARYGLAKGYQTSNWVLTKRLLGYMRPFLHFLAIIVLAALLREPTYVLLAPLFVMLIVDHVLISTPSNQTNWFLEMIKNTIGVHNTIGLLAILCLLIIVLSLVRSVFFVVHGFWRVKLAERILRILRRDIYYRLLNRSLRYLNQVRTGQIISRMTSDMRSIERFYSQSVRESFRMAIQFFLAVYILFQFDVELTLFCCALLPFVFLVTRLYSNKLRFYLSESKSHFDALNSFLFEGIVGHKLIKSFGQEEHFSILFSHVNRTYLNKVLRAGFVQSMYRPFSSAVSAIGIALIILYGGQKVFNEQLTVGTLILFGTYFTQLIGPVRMFSWIIDCYQDGVTSARRVFDVIDFGEDVQEAKNPIDLPRLKGAIEFINVSFTYNSAKEALKNVSLSIKPEEKVALVGFVGAGKTTLVELVPRFYDVSLGKVTVDGYDIRTVSLKSLRSQIGIVMQDAFVFSSTIKENIAYGKPTASDEEIEKVTKAAQIHDYIMSLPNGYDTMIGERGLTLSGGQRQRITVARTLLTDPRILILDDSTSNVDAETETLIKRAIDALLEERTALIITQRASTCKDANRVVVMDEGQVIAVDTHVNLLKSCEKYQKIIESQMFSADTIKVG